MDEFYDWIVYGLAMLGGVAVLANGVRGIEFILSPLSNIKGKLKEQEEMISSDERRLDKVEKEQGELHEQVAVIGLAIAELFNHILTGNDTDKLKEQQDKLISTFIK